MGLRDALAPVINMVMFITYAVFALVGLGLIVLGVAYYSEISGADKTVAGIACAAGFFMMLVGGGAVWATKNGNALVMLVVLLIDVILFCALLASCMVGFVIANQVRDPVTRGVEEAFATNELRQNGWDGVKETLGHGGPKACDEFRIELELPANVAIIKAAGSDQKTFAGNCTMVHTKIDHASAKLCEHCWTSFQNYTVDKIKSNLWPATYAVFALFMFVVISICLNFYMIDNCDPDDEDDDEDAADKWMPDGTVKMASLILSGIVGLFGLLLMIFGIVAYQSLSSGACPEGKDCTNWAVVGIIILGTFFFLLAILNVVACFIGGFLGKNIMRILSLVWIVLAFVLLLVGICFALVAGAISSINKEYDLNFAKVRADANQADATLCPATMSDDACKAKLKTKTEDSFNAIALVLAFVCAGFIVVLYLTLQAVKLFSADDGDDDDDGDE